MDQKNYIYGRKNVSDFICGEKCLDKADCLWYAVTFTVGRQSLLRREVIAMRRAGTIVTLNTFRKERRRRIMSLTEINAAKEVNGEKRTASVAKDLGENCQDAIEKFGAEVVHTNFKSAAKITAQAAMRRYLDAGKGQEEIATLMENWKPGVAMDRVIDPVAALVSRWDSYSPVEQAEILKKLGKKK